MTTDNLYSLRFPIGEYVKPEVISPQILQHYISEIASFPERLKKEAASLNDQQLDTEYRPNGWTIRQVVHHCADSHMNSFIRFKLALTEDRPTIKPYEEQLWAEHDDEKKFPIEASLKILEALHERWVVLLKSMTPEDFKKTFIHPATGKITPLDENTGIYAWHGNHHLAHVTELKKRMGWEPHPRPLPEGEGCGMLS